MEKTGGEKSCGVGEQENDGDTSDAMELQMEGVEAVVTADPSASKSQPLQTDQLNTQVRVGPCVLLYIYTCCFVLVYMCMFLQMSTLSSEYTEGSEEEMEDFYEDYDVSSVYSTLSMWVI